MPVEAICTLAVLIIQWSPVRFGYAISDKTSNLLTPSVVNSKNRYSQRKNQKCQKVHPLIRD